uniref:Uncharacterized protein n=1 Tax=Ralstonia solanacearum TaxID=305 RepID=A0A0S4XBP4_RALSL|nr:conserved protein of unknown function [Ralstonia solanacearum]CUV36882.1 conserved protein of unknown function [Ralstonia solanacearum]CUV42195.1 conserved protein of unknown function [Ralstonia solanacearum]CUV61527.1 conserved protein of unknown function [Ralstonia solanacearum]
MRGPEDGLVAAGPSRKEASPPRGDDAMPADERVGV